VQVNVKVHPGGYSTFCQSQAMTQAIFRVAVASPDSDTRKIATMVPQDGLEWLRCTVHLVSYPLVLEIDERRKVRSTVLDSLNRRKEGRKASQ
jgi:hypothetical protein